MLEPLAAVLACLVIGVSDGDTLTARCASGEQHQNVKVRLAEIDAPEKGQPFGARSKQQLAALCFRSIATVLPKRRDRYGRVVARVNCGGVDASTAQVESGMAWVYDRYVIDRSLYQLQARARESRAGLWVDANPTPPWEWRKLGRPAQRSGHAAAESGSFDVSPSLTP